MDAVRHLIKTIPGLTDISKTAASYLFCPLTKSRKCRIAWRPQKSKSSNIEAHLHDLSALIQCTRNDKQNCVLLTVDGGCDWSTTSYKNIFCFYKYWRKEDLDLLTVTSYDAGFATYNSIEHLWTPVSKQLAGVKDNTCADGGDVARALLPKLTKEEIEKKEIEMFD